MKNEQKLEMNHEQIDGRATKIAQKLQQADAKIDETARKFDLLEAINQSIKKKLETMKLTSGDHTTKIAKLMKKAQISNQKTEQTTLTDD